MCSILAFISFSFVGNEGVTYLEAAAEVALSNRQKWDDPDLGSEEQ